MSNVLIIGGAGAASDAWRTNDCAAYVPWGRDSGGAEWPGEVVALGRRSPARLDDLLPEVALPWPSECERLAGLNRDDLPQDAPEMLAGGSR